MSCVADAENAPVKFGDIPFNSLVVEGCGKFSTVNSESQVYVDAKKKVTDAKAKLMEADGKVKNAKASVAASEKAAEAAVKKCQCRTYEASSKAVKEANGKVAKDNADTWNKAAQLECVLAGTNPTDCKVPPIPVVKAPTLTAGINADSCVAPDGLPVLADQCQGFRVSDICGGGKVALKSYGCLGDTPTWDKNKVYTCPPGWYWPTADQYFSALANDGCEDGRTSKVQAGGYAMYGKCGWSNFEGPDRKTRYRYLFSDSASNRRYQYAAETMGNGYLFDQDNTASWFGGIACI